MTINDKKEIDRIRGQVIRMMAAFFCLLIILLFFFLLPTVRTNRRMRVRIDEVERELRVMCERYKREPLHIMVKNAKNNYRRLQRTWEQLRFRVDTFNGHSPLKSTSSAEDARIDFKVALFDTRDRLLEKANKAGVILPKDLGVVETIGSEEDAESRLWHLASVAMLIERCMDLGIPTVRSINLADPVDHLLATEPDLLIRECPVKIELGCDYKHLLLFISSLLENNAFFALRSFEVEQILEQNRSWLKVTILCGSEVFMLQKKDESSLPSTAPEIFPDDKTPTETETEQ